MSTLPYHTLGGKPDVPIKEQIGEDSLRDVKVDKVCVTPEMAQSWLSAHNFDGQRRMRTSQVIYLASEMKNGTFLPYTTIEFVFKDGQKHLTNGQHRLAAIVRSGISQLFIVVERVARNSDDVGMIYGLTDINLRRTVADLTSAIHLENETGLSRTQLNELGACVTFMQNGFHRPKSRNVDRSALVDSIREHAEFAKEYYETIAGAAGSVRHSLGRAATLSIGIVTYRYAYKVYGSRVDEFWRGAAFDDELKASDPRKLAYQHFLMTTMPTGGYRTIRRGGQIMGASESARYVATCYNKFIQGDKVTLIRPMKTFTILGTPVELS